MPRGSELFVRALRNLKKQPLFFLFFWFFLSPTVYSSKPMTMLQGLSIEHGRLEKAFEKHVCNSPEAATISWRTSAGWQISHRHGSPVVKRRSTSNLALSNNSWFISRSVLSPTGAQPSFAAMCTNPSSDIPPVCSADCSLKRFCAASWAIERKIPLLRRGEDMPIVEEGRGFAQPCSQPH